MIQALSVEEDLGYLRAQSGFARGDLCLARAFMVAI